MTAEAELASLHARLVELIGRDKRPAHYVLVDCQRQLLRLSLQGQTLKEWPVSTAANGLGNANGSYQTPTGLHQIADIIGRGAAPALLFQARIAQPLCAHIESRPVSTDTDTVTSRILRLQGLEPGVNSGEGCDSYMRYIYIHGTAEEGLLGQPVSHGCIRMANQAVIELAALVTEKTLLYVY